jgi:hypothetical protein
MHRSIQRREKLLQKTIVFASGVAVDHITAKYHQIRLGP